MLNLFRTTTNYIEGRELYKGDFMIYTFYIGQYSDAHEPL